ncbi:hypothetical protein [Virgibacillus halodenitrificans]|uniref:hypothetical protein n=1 Tax=Virgibacillus halodenitrificans TaxID=1482 RepID=UPI000EF556A3|nr:hypothetical protein [Virgibacillus halodenitrificans]
MPEVIVYHIDSYTLLWIVSLIIFTALMVMEIITIRRKNRQVKRLKQLVDDLRIVLDVPIKEARKILNKNAGGKE